MIKVLFFDLGETLVKYYSKEQFKDILVVVFKGIYEKCGISLQKTSEYYWQRMVKENYENSDFSVRPLEERLRNIFELNNDEIDMNVLCDIFMKPILDISKIYDDTLFALNSLSKKYSLCLISNMPWGCPKSYFIQDLRKYDLLGYFKELVFCVDVGFRKPHRKIFEYALQRMHSLPEESIMIGDRYNWDIEGASKLNIKGILVDRKNENPVNILKVEKLQDIEQEILELNNNWRG